MPGESTCRSRGARIVTKWNAALFDRPHKRVVNLSHAFHHTALSLVSSVGSVGLGSAGSGAGTDWLRDRVVLGQPLGL